MKHKFWIVLIIITLMAVCNNDVLAEIMILPNGLNIIEDESFMNNKAISMVVIPSDVTAIGDRAFAGCENLVNITIPPNVTIIGENAFDDCNSFLTIYGEERTCAAAYAGNNMIAFIPLSAKKFPPQLDELISKKGMWITWPVKEINVFHQALGYRYPLSDQASAGQVSRREAIDIARNYILQYVKSVCPQYYDRNGIPPAIVDEGFMDGLKITAFITSDNETDNPPHCWQIHFYEDEWLTISLDTLVVYVDAITGDIIQFFTAGGNG